MTNADKNKVIGVLMCAAQRVWEERRYATTAVVANYMCEPQKISAQAGYRWVVTNDDLGADAFIGAPGFIDHGTICLEAAYRLIESSPTLRREWFGR